jgi:tRNA A37 methylthiotransferase MiaB
MLKQGVWQIVSDQTKKFRKEKLIFALEKNRQIETKNLVGNQRLVLILKSTSYGWWGLSDNYWPTKIKVKKNANEGLVGKIVPVKITDFEDKALRGNLIRTN